MLVFSCSIIFIHTKQVFSNAACGSARRPSHTKPLLHSMKSGRHTVSKHENHKFHHCLEAADPRRPSPTLQYRHAETRGAEQISILMAFHPSNHIKTNTKQIHPQHPFFYEAELNNFRNYPIFPYHNIGFYRINHSLDCLYTHKH